MLWTFILENLKIRKEVYNTRSELDTLSNNLQRTDLGMLEVPFVQTIRYMYAQPLCQQHR